MKAKTNSEDFPIQFYIDYGIFVIMFVAFVVFM